MYRHLIHTDTAHVLSTHTQLVISSTLLVPRKWYHLAMTVTSAGITTYVNGTVDQEVEIQEKVISSAGSINK